MRLRDGLLTVVGVLLLAPAAAAQHLWWDLAGQRDATCLYGQITVLKSHPHIYYCGATGIRASPPGDTAASSTTARASGAPSSRSGTRRRSCIRR